jgi:hypothetical protein
MRLATWRASISHSNQIACHFTHNMAGNRLWHLMLVRALLDASSNLPEFVLGANTMYCGKNVLNSSMKNCLDDHMHLICEAKDLRPLARKLPLA